MSFLKLLLLGAVTTLTVLAFAASSSATVLCRAEASVGPAGVCPAGKVYPAGTAIKLETKSTEPLFVTTTDNIACKRSSIEMKLEAQGSAGNPLKAQVTAFSFFECTMVKLKSACTISAVNLPSQGVFSWAKESNGTFALEKGAGKAEPGIAVTCGAGLIKCAYEVKPTMEVIGGNPSQAIVNEVALKTMAFEGFTTCPKSTTWSKANYRSAKPQQAYLANQAEGSPPPAGSALCKTAPAAGFCSAFKTYAAGQKFEATSESVIFSAGTESVTCKSSTLTLEGKTAGSTTTHATGVVSGLTFGTCTTNKGEACTVEAVHVPYQTELLYTTGSSGELLASSGGTGGPGAHFGTCIGLKVKACGYTTGEALIDVIGGNPAKEIVAKGTLELTENGGVECPAEITLSAATYKSTSPTTVYVAKEVIPTSVMCKVAPSEGVCPEGQAYPPEQEILGEATKPVLVTNEEDVTCKSSKATFKGKTKGAPTAEATGSVTALSFEGCELTGGAICTVEAIHAPYGTELHYTSGSSGTLSVKNGGGGEPMATVSCADGLLACVFSAEPTALAVEGGNPATLVVSKLPMKLSTKEGFLKCPKEATLSATYKATSPTAVYVAAE